MTYKYLKETLTELINLAPVPTKDKLSHFLYGTISALLIAFITKLGLPIWLIPTVVIVGAVTKEFYDLWIKGTFFSFPDIAYTIISSILIYILLSI